MTMKEASPWFLLPWWQQIVLVACGVVLSLECGAAVAGWRWWDHPGNGGTKDRALPTASQERRHLQAQPQQDDSSSSMSTLPVIINVGLPRTGSDVLYEYFQCLGVDTVRHRYCCRDAHNKRQETCRETCGECMARNLQQERQPPWINCAADDDKARIFLQVDVETSDPYSWFLPQHHALDAFTATTPTHDNRRGVIWILTLRSDATTWAESILHWHSMTQRLTTALGIPTNDGTATLELPSAVTHQQVVASLQQRVTQLQDDTWWNQRRQALAAAYQRHVQHVRSTAARLDVPLVEVVIDDNSDLAAWQQTLQGHDISLTLSSSASSKCWKGYDGRYENDWKDFSFPL